MALAIVQFDSGSLASGIGTPGSPQLSSNPAVGNALIVFLHTDSSTSGITPNTSGWIVIGNNFDPRNYLCNTYTLLRYAQSGDTATNLPNMATAGNCHWSYAIYEVSGVAGSVGSDIQTVGGMSIANPPGEIVPIPIQQVPQQSGTLALFSGAWTSNPAPAAPAGWATDIASGTVPGGMACLGAWHYSGPTAGTAIDGGAANSSLGTTSQAILQSAPPSSGPYPRQSYSSTPGANTIAGFQGNLQGAPVPGSLVLGFLITSVWDIAQITIGPAWTIGASYSNSGNYSALLLYRYAQSGDTAVLPEFVSAYTGSNEAFGYSAYEIGNVTGVWADDFQSAQVGSTNSGSVTTSVGTTMEPNSLAIVVANGNIGGNGTGSAPTLSGSFTNLDTLFGTGAIFGGSESYASSGSSVSTTITPPNTPGFLAYIQAIFGALVTVDVNLSGVGTSGAVEGLGPEILINLAAAASAGAVQGVIAEDITNVPVSGAASAGAVAVLLPEIFVALGPVATAGVAAGVEGGSLAVLSGVSTTAGFEPISLVEVSVNLAPAIAEPAAAPITFGQAIPFPLFTLMRDTPVAVIGSMSDTPLALVGRMPPSGQLPIGRQVFLTGVSATAFAGTVTPFFNVYVHLAPAIASGVAAPVVAA